MPAIQTIDTLAPTTSFDRSFLAGIGSCHAYLTLREDWREHARLIQSEVGFRSVRAHAIFHDLVGIYAAEKGEPPRYNFFNLDKIYDFWLSVGLKPYVELSFTPQALAIGEQTIFRYRANVTPPADLARWDELIRAFTTHLVERYGIQEVASWYFEVWNEPDLEGGFWVGGQERYFELYAHTARAVKQVDPRLRVGGPASSRSMWVEEFLTFCARSQAPLDFLSTHHYCADAGLVMGQFSEQIVWRGQKAMSIDVRRTVAAVRASAFPDIEVHYTEWNVSPIHEDRFGKDSEFTAAFVLQTLQDVSGSIQRYMLWAISDIFEESGPGETPFSGKYGLVNLHGIKKPLFHAFRFLARLYEQQLPTEGSLYATRSAEGGLRVLSWNYCEPLEVDFSGGEYRLDEHEKDEQLRFSGMLGRVRVRGWRVDRQHGNSFRAWQAMGSPQYPNREQIEALKLAAEAVLFTDRVEECAAVLELGHVLPPSGFVFYEVDPA
jgi:xylan 1,4-beta-xylosidase